MTDKPKPRAVKLARSAYQPNKDDLEEPIEFPEEVTTEDLARAVTHPSKIRWTDRPE